MTALRPLLVQAPKRDIELVVRSIFIAIIGKARRLYAFDERAIKAIGRNVG